MELLMNTKYVLSSDVQLRSTIFVHSLIHLHQVSKCFGSSGSDFLEGINKITVIVYYPGKDDCNETEINSTWSIFDKDYLKKLNKICDYNHFWVYKDDENLKYYHPEEVKWEKDNNQFIEKTFFEFHYPCFSAVIIDENGKFISYFGEFGKSTIWELTTELINKKE